MRELYDQLASEGEAGIDRLISEQTQESLQLDFKRKEVERNGEFSTNDRKTLAAGLSGFANSAGGLLIFGVDARPNADRIDCAKEARPIADIRRFLSAAQSEIGQLVQPRLDGVSLGIIPSDRLQSSGYLLVHVERSERRPHRSEAKGQKGYYKRVGDSFLEMEHYDIEDAFKRKSVASLDIGFKVIPISSSNKRLICQLQFRLYNNSNYTAKSPYLRIKIGPNLSEDMTGKPDIKMSTDEAWRCYEASPSDVIHPGLSKVLAAYRIEIERETFFSINGQDGHLWREWIHYRYGCEDQGLTEGQELISWDSLMPTLSLGDPTSLS